MPSLFEVFQNSAKVFPDRTALVEPDRPDLTYHELEQRVSTLSWLLLQNDLGPLHRIGVYIPKNLESVVSILAILKMGGAYVPVDETSPPSRNAFIFKDSQARGILIQKDLLKDFKEVFHQIEDIVDLPEFPDLALILCRYKTEPIPDLPTDLAYVLYTSGSTGNPKGVMITHRNALGFINWCTDTFDLSEHDVFSSIAPFHFDLSIFDLYVGLKTGAAIVLMDQKAAKNPFLITSLIEKHQISVLYATPSLLKLILQYGKLDRFEHEKVRLVLFAGEVFPIEPLKALKAKWNKAAYFNLYGPTETNVVTWFQIPKQIPEKQNSPFPIGKTCSHVDCSLWEDGILPNKPGSRGELIVRGESVMPAYLNQPEKTKAAFISDENGEKWYRTGDIVELDNNLDIVFMGRRDRMVKRRGYRIELGEIEQALHQHTGIAAAAAIAIKTDDGDTIVKAFVIIKDKVGPLKAFHLKQFCTEHLPMYMLPDKFIFVDELPKTSSHKVDYQKLSTL